jgi:MFS family permease
MFSLGKFVISTRIGIIADTYGHKLALIISGFIMIAGALLWGNASQLGLVSLFIAQFVLGLGTGTLGVLRSYVVEQTEPEKRTYIMAQLSALQYAGFAGTPLLGSAVYVIGSSMSLYWQYAFPSYLIVLLGILCLILLFTLFKDIEHEALPAERDEAVSNQNLKTKVVSIFSQVHSPRSKALSSGPIGQNTSYPYASLLNEDECSKDVERSEISLSEKKLRDGDVAGVGKTVRLRNSSVESKATAIESGINYSIPSNSESEESLNRRRVAEVAQIFILLVTLNFTTRGGIAVHESQGSKILLEYYKLSQISLGSIISSAGIIGTINLLLFKSFWTNYFSDMALTVGGLILFGLSQLFITDFGPVSNDPELKSISPLTFLITRI